MALEFPKRLPAGQKPRRNFVFRVLLLMIKNISHKKWEKLLQFSAKVFQCAINAVSTSVEVENVKGTQTVSDLSRA